MAKRISATIDTYEKDGEKKYKSVNIGVILEGEHGEYMLLDPNVNLAGVLMCQRMLKPEKKAKAVMCNIWSDDPKPQQSSATGGADDFDEDLIPF